MTSPNEAGADTYLESVARQLTDEVEGPLKEAMDAGDIQRIQELASLASMDDSFRDALPPDVAGSLRRINSLARHDSASLPDAFEAFKGATDAFRSRLVDASSVKS